MRYGTVLFDVGGTLVGPRESFGAVYARVLSGLGLERSPAELEAALRCQWSEMDRLVPRGRDRYAHFPGGETGYWSRFVEGTLARVGAGQAGDGLARRALGALREAFKDPAAWEVFDDVAPALRALRGHGAKLGVVSNWDSRLPSVLERLDLARWFDGVVVSSTAGVEKPDPAIFRRALELLEADPESTIHVGDLPEIDLAGARAAGLRAVLVDRRGRLDPSLGALPDLRSLPDLARGA